MSESKRQKTKKLMSGMTMVEMMIAITILVIGMEGFTLLFSRAWKSNSFTLEMGRASLSVSQGLNRMVNYIRGCRQGDDGSYPIESNKALNNELTIFSDYDKDGITERLHFYKSGQSVFMGVRKPSGTVPKTYAEGDQQVITIANNIVNTAGEPIFYYFDNEYGGDQSDPPLDTPANVSDIRIVKIHLKININPNHAPDNMEMQSFVEMRNLSDYNNI